MSTPDASGLPRRGPLHERLAPLASAWREANGYPLCARIASPADCATVWLADRTHLPRGGYKGRGTAEWLARAGLAVPTAPNRWCRDAAGAAVLRLGAQDFLIEDEEHGRCLADLAAAWSTASGARGYPVPRQHALASFVLGGPRAPEVLARLCAVDLRPARFADDAIAQTQVALTTALVTRVAGAAPRYRLHVDTSLALYLWDRLCEVAADLGGGVLGADQLPPA